MITYVMIFIIISELSSWTRFQAFGREQNIPSTVIMAPAIAWPVSKIFEVSSGVFLQWHSALGQMPTFFNTQLLTVSYFIYKQVK